MVLPAVVLLISVTASRPWMQNSTLPSNLIGYSLSYNRDTDLSLSPSETDPPTVTAPPVTITVTLDPSSRSTTSTSKSSSTSSTSSQSTSVSSLSSSSATDSSPTDPPEYVTTTYLTSEGTSLLTITAIVSNPAGHTHTNPATNNFFSNKTAVIGVFTACGIIVFACIVAVIAWAARRRTLKRWEREKADKESFDRRNFLQDEVQDELAPSEKSWWAGASGASIPEGAGMPMQTVNFTPFYGVPPVPPLPTELSPVATTFAGSTGSRSTAEMIGPISHPYSGSIVSDSYHTNSSNTQRGSITSISTVRDAARSPPPSIPLPPVPYSNRGQDTAHLPMILEGPPSSSSTEGWASQIQSLPTHSTEAPPLPSNTNPSLSRFPSSSKAASHPYAFPVTDRASHLFAGDVLLDLGNHGGVGRSLSGSRPAHPLPTTARVLQDGSSRGQSSAGHNASHGSHPTSKQASASGLSDGGWFDDPPSDMAKVGTGAAASGESVFGNNMASNTRLSMDIAERRRVPHDPRFSGLFGQHLDHRQSDSMASEHETEEGSYAPRVLRVTNE